MFSLEIVTNLCLSLINRLTNGFPVSGVILDQKKILNIFAGAQGGRIRWGSQEKNNNDRIPDSLGCRGTTRKRHVSVHLKDWMPMNSIVSVLFAASIAWDVIFLHIAAFTMLKPNHRVFKSCVTAKEHTWLEKQYCHDTTCFWCDTMLTFLTRVSPKRCEIYVDCMLL